ncbi:ABC transporter substrate-binding protein [Sphaerimonospora cavernae]|uniref:ABC transporter substrate-binding protein n=1 Tax=Sphaerimonospora cavernae TaxID=1740611 RepID=A0ABV6U1W9_9ACTN
MSKRTAAAAIPLVSCLALQTAAGPAHAAAGDAEITVATCSPYQTVTPANADRCGGDMLDALFTGLLEYVPGTSKSRYGVAKSITTRDNRRFRVTLRKGWKFHDGTPVRARNFVEAWNLAASARNGVNSFLFEEIKGYGKRRMSGLKVTGDYTFTIELTKPFGPFLAKLGHVAFSPLPDSALKEPASLIMNPAGRKPIGNGPFRVVKWSPGGETVVERFDDYAGTAKPYVTKITYRAYRDHEAAYRDLLAGDLDFLGTIPYSKGGQYKEDLDGRVIARPNGVISGIGLPPKIAANHDVRRAISMAIDREGIAKRLWNGMRVPARSWVPPTAEGARRDSCGQACMYDPSVARRILAQAKAKGVKLPVTIPLYYSADGGHQETVTAIAASVNRTFKGELKVVPKAKPTVIAFMNAASAGKLNGMIRMSWQLDFPHIQNVLGPLYSTGSPSNYWRYRNPRFDARLKIADRQVSPSRALKHYMMAETMLAHDLPFIPLWNDQDTAGYSSRVTAAKLTPFGWLDPVSVKAE